MRPAAGQVGEAGVELTSLKDLPTIFRCSHDRCLVDTRRYGHHGTLLQRGGNDWPYDPASCLDASHGPTPTDLAPK